MPGHSPHMCAATVLSEAQERATRPQNAYSGNSVHVPSTSTSISLPINRSPSPREATSQHPHPSKGSDNVAQNIVAELTTHGICVRDFAYENTLPPVTPVPRFSVQVQPRLRTLKRTRDLIEGHDDGEESDEEDPSIGRTFYIDSNGTGSSHAYRYRKKTTMLERTLTEPANEDLPSQGFNTDAPVFAQPSYYRPLLSPPRPRREGAIYPTTPHNARSPTRPLSPINTFPQSQPGVYGDSQESEQWVDTPLVTPNGSLQWPIHNTSAFPASQLENILPQLPETEEQQVTMSQLGFTPERSQRPFAPASAAPSPAGSPSRVRARHPQIHPPPTEFRARTQTPARSGSPASGSPPRRSPRAGVVSPSPPPPHEVPEPRYDLRQRPQNAKPAAPRATSRTRAAGQATSKVDKSPPPAKKRKVTPPPCPTLSRGVRGRKKQGDVNDSNR